MSKTTTDPECIFCNSPVEKEWGPHHILPKTVQTLLGWKSQRATRILSQYKVPLCKKCHRIVTRLQEPLIKIIRSLRELEVPLELVYVMEEIHRELTGDPTSGGD